MGKGHGAIITMAKLGVHNDTQHATGTTVSKQGQDSCQERSPAKVGTVRLPGGGGKSKAYVPAEALAAIPARGCSMSANNGSLSRSPFP